jgi:hypothetical protein
VVCEHEGSRIDAVGEETWDFNYTVSPVAVGNIRFFIGIESSYDSIQYSKSVQDSRTVHYWTSSRGFIRIRGERSPANKQEWRTKRKGVLYYELWIQHIPPNFMSYEEFRAAKIKDAVLSDGGTNLDIHFGATDVWTIKVYAPLPRGSWILRW